MSETEFYQPGDPEYNPNDPLKPVAKAVQGMRGTVAGLRSQMSQLSEGLKEVVSHNPHVINLDQTPIFEMEEVFPESDLRVENYMVDVHLPEADVVPDYAAVDAEVSLTALNDNVNHPKHYNQYVGFEVIDVAKQLRSPDGEPGSNYFRGTVFKYLARAGWKMRPGMTRKEEIAKEIEDLEKGKFYLQAELDRLREKMEKAE